MTDIEKMFSEALDLFRNWKEVSEETTNIKSLESNLKVKLFHYK